MNEKTPEEIKLEKLLTIDDAHHSATQRKNMIIQGVNWLTLMQELMLLFFYKLPLALINLLHIKKY